MLTIFTCPKAFIGNNAVLQNNAIQSWKLSNPEAEIILIGNKEARSESTYMAFLNCDVIVTDSLLPMIKKIPFDCFLAAGRRWEFNMDKKIAFDDSQWSLKLKEQVRKNGYLLGPHALDYFIFPRNQIADLPDFFIGRPKWDNWFMGSKS
jgi:hypothetical protein